MLKLEDIKTGALLEGLVPGRAVTVMATIWHGDHDLEVIYQDPEKRLDRSLLSRVDEGRLTLAAAEDSWPLDGDGRLFKLASEARRIKSAHLFDPYVAVEAADIDPLPHQIEAVYHQMMPIQPLRFVLADDPGAGKTIMSGLYIRELALRGDLERVLIVAPGSLVVQWQDELWQRFYLDFRILTNDMVDTARTGNPFNEHDLLIARLDQLARRDDLQDKLAASRWDLVVVDEAHKMSAHYYGKKLNKTKRYQLGERLRDLTRHLLLLTATPHSGKQESYMLFLALLDQDRFGGRLRGGNVPDASDLMRRCLKESLLTFEGKPLFPERRAHSVKYDLSPPEQRLYDEVTDYVRHGMDRAKQIEQKNRRRGLVVGFALAALQRRLASSPHAIYRSLRRRRERLENQAIRSRLTWQSILDERGEHDLNLTPADANQARTRLEEADRTVELRIGETFSQVLYPVQSPGQSEIRWSSVRVTGSDGLYERVVRKLESSQHLITSYAGTLVRRDLDRPEAPLWDGDHIGIRTLWSYYCRFLYMPRLAGFGVLTAAISRGVADLNWQNDTFAYADTYNADENRYPGLQAPAQVEVTQSLTALLVRPTRAAVQFDAESRPADDEEKVPDDVEDIWKPKDPDPGRPPAPDPRPTRFYGRMELDPVRAMRDLGGIIDEVTKHLTETR